MLIQNLNDNEVMIRHETVIDSDNLFSVIRMETINDGKDIEDYTNNNDELILFDDFIKEKLKNKELGIQVFEIVNKQISIGSFFSKDAIWENKENWNEWNENYKNTHQMCVYFYLPENNQNELFSGMVHISSSTQTCFKKSEKEVEYFKLSKNEYSINHNDMASTFEIELFPDVIYKYLKLSKHTECRNIIKEFNFNLLQLKLPQKIEQKKHKI